MITILYSKVDKLWEDEFFKRLLFSLPQQEQQKILQYKNQKDQQVRIGGKLLLQQIMNDFGLTPEYALKDIKYDVFNKPHLHANFYFSIAHSENFVVCAASVKNSIGIDVEKIKPIDVLLLKDSFTKEEWHCIEKEKFALCYFYHLWTRKEAVLKAIGKGIYEEMGKVPVLQDEMTYNAQPYYIFDINIDTAYKIALASGKKDVFEVKEFVIKNIHV